MITKKEMRQLIRNGLNYDKLLQFAFQHTWISYRLSHIYRFGNETLFTHQLLYNELKARGHKVGDFGEIYELTISDTKIRVTKNSYCLPALLPYGEQNAIFPIYHDTKLEEVIKHLEEVPEMQQHLLETIEFVNSNYDEAAKEVAVQQKRQKLSASVASAFVRKKLDSMGIDYRLEEQKIQTTIVVNNKSRQQLKIKFKHSKLLKDKESVLNSITEAITLFCDPVIPTKIR